MIKSKKLFIVYPLLVILVLSGMFTLNAEYSYAAESFDVSHGTKWVQGENIDSGLRIKTKAGTIAYCLNQGCASPSGAYTDKMTLSSKLKAVLYYGYPNNKTFGSVTLTADQARCATQLAVWAHDTSSKGNKISLGNLHGANDKKTDGDNVLKAAKWLYNKADSGYSAPTKPTLADPKITKPGDNTPKYYNETYVRIGPYKFTTTNNSYTSNNKVTVNLGGAPAGTKIGNAAGNFVGAPTAGTEFYVYLPSAKLTDKGTGSFDLSVSYDYKYEKAATFTAYKKDSTQNVAVATEKEYANGTNKASAKGDLAWTTGKLTKVDSADSSKVIADTEFDVYYDPTPANTGNNDWKLMYKMKTDGNGVIRIPGLGTGTYKLVETKPNPNYALNSESGGSDEIIFQVTSVSTESIQVMKNNLIGISCEVDKDTIKKTSAAYKSLPDQEGFDNTGSETYRYHVDYRSTADVWADEFVVDDPLPGVDAGQIRVTEIWTPIAYGDHDGKMNIWYKTNKTDTNTDYSDASALGTNPVSPNNPDKVPVMKNTGYKLWAKDVKTTERTNLIVSDLGLGEYEYITALRLEHGRVEKGFTTRNYSYESLNDDSVEDWTPSPDDRFYTKESADAEGLKPLTYLVMCPDPLAPPTIINNSADAFIARNIHLKDDDEDEVTTEVIDTFKETPIDEEVKGATAIHDEDGKVLGKFAEVAEKEVKGDAPKTDDKFRLGLAIAIMLAMVGIVTLVVFRKNSRKKVLPVVLVAVLLAGSFAAPDQLFASSRTIEDSFERYGLEYSLVSASRPIFGGRENTYKVKYEVDQIMDAKTFDAAGQDKMLPENLDVDIKGYDGRVALKKEVVEPLYIKKQAQVDKHEVIKGLSAEDITDLPDSRAYTVRSDASANATVSKELKRAGVSLKVSGRDSDGIPNSWDATVVYRGLETYLEKYQYSVAATYAGNVSADAGETRTAASVDAKDYNDLTEEEAKERNEQIIKEKYMPMMDGDTPKAAAEPAPEPESAGWQTADFIKFFGLLLGLAAVSFLVFTVLNRRKMKQDT